MIGSCLVTLRKLFVVVLLYGSIVSFRQRLVVVGLLLHGYIVTYRQLLVVVLLDGENDLLFYCDMEALFHLDKDWLLHCYMETLLL